MLCPPVRTVPDKTSTTSTSPPAKAPPVSHTSYRNLSTRTTSQANPKTTPTAPTTTRPHLTAPPTPPSTTPSTSTEDPIILTTNVPILPKARPGHPPINTTWVGPPQSHHPPHTATPTRIPLQVTIPRPHRNGQLLPFNFPLTSNTTSIPRHTPPDNPPHQAQHRPLTSNQPLPQIPLQCSRRYPPFQTPHSQSSKLPRFSRLSCGLLVRPPLQPRPNSIHDQAACSFTSHHSHTSCDDQKRTQLFSGFCFLVSTFSYYGLQSTIQFDQDLVSPCNFFLDRSCFSTSDLYHLQRTASTLAFQWRGPPITMNSLRFYFSSMKTRKSHHHRRTIHLTRYRLNQLQILQPRNPHHQPPATSRQTNRFGPKYTPSNHHMPSWASSLTSMSTDSFSTNTWTVSTHLLTPLSDINL